MDRDNRWERVVQAYAAMTYWSKAARSIQADPIAMQMLQKSYDDGVTDEFVKPSVVTGRRQAGRDGPSKDDSVIFFNFRPDRAREISRAFIFEDFDGFERKLGFFKAVLRLDDAVRQNVCRQTRRGVSSRTSLEQHVGRIPLRARTT